MYYIFYFAYNYLFAMIHVICSVFNCALHIFALNYSTVFAVYYYKCFHFDLISALGQTLGYKYLGRQIYLAPICLGDGG